MEKNITVHVVKSDKAEYICASKGKANDAVQVLAAFGIKAEVVSEKRKVKLA